MKNSPANLTRLEYSGDSNELKELKTAAGLMTDESLRATRDMLRRVNMSYDAGAATLSMLHKQGEQLNNVEKEMDTIREETKGAEDNLIQLERNEKYCFGCCFSHWCLCLGRRKTDSNVWKQPTSTSTNLSLQPNPKTTQQKEKTSNYDDGDFIPRITNDEKEDEMEENLRGVSHFVKGLKVQAQDMGTELGKHLDTVDRINAKGISNDILIDATTKKAKLLRT